MSTTPKHWARPAVAVAAVGAAVAIPLGLGMGDEARAADGHLEPFSACEDLRAYAADATIARMSTPIGRGIPMPVDTLQSSGADTSGREAAGTAQAAADHSTTNVQYAGIDEPDIVKTDGKRIFAIARGRLHAVDASGDRPRVVGSLAFPETMTPTALILSGDRLLVIGTRWTSASGPVATSPDDVTGREIAPAPRTVISIVDVSDPAAMRVTDRMSTTSDYSSARLRDGTVRVVLNGAPARYPASYRTGFSGTVERALAAREVRAMPASDWLPSYRLEDATGKPVGDEIPTPCTTVSRPTDGSKDVGTVTVLTIDPARGARPIDQDTVMGAAGTTMMSEDNLYVTGYDMDDGGRATTRIHVFDVSDRNRTDYRATGGVEGSLLNQFSMDEHDGVLRVATTRQPSMIAMAEDSMVSPAPRTSSDSMVTTLRLNGRRLDEIGRVSGLGRGEQIHSVRFIGERGYVVTFRQTDPLYTVDLSDPAHPRTTGELKINGYSAYLHPVDEDHVIGVGQDATDQGRQLGTQVSLFDVSDPESPRRVSNWTAPGAYSEVEWDHHAFLWWKPTSTAVIPLAVGYEERIGGPARASAIALRITEAGIGDATPLTQGPSATSGRITRSLVIGDTLYTLSDGGLVARDLTTLDDGTWVPLS